MSNEQWVTVSYLARLAGVSAETVWRDVEVLMPLAAEMKDIV